MKHKLKTKLTRDDVLKLLSIYNTLNSVVTETHDCLDMRLSQLNDMQDKVSDLSNMFEFRPVIDDEGNPNHWLPKVLPNDPKAWYWKE